jgi:ribonuclease BN (tRNA processing enzyme)
VKNLVLYHTVDYGDDRRERMTAEVKGVYEGAVFVPEDMETVEL